MSLRRATKTKMAGKVAIRKTMRQSKNGSRIAAKAAARNVPKGHPDSTMDPLMQPNFERFCSSPQTVASDVDQTLLRSRRFHQQYREKDVAWVAGPGHCILRDTLSIDAQLRIKSPWFDPILRMLSPGFEIIPRILRVDSDFCRQAKTFAHLTT